MPKVADLLTMNQRKHWTWVSKNKRAWRTAAADAAFAAGVVFPQAGACSFVRCVFPVKQMRRRDPHNYFPTVKPLVDGLVDAGVWPDDTPEFVETREPLFAVCEDVYILLWSKKENDVPLR